jgi:hypothetical protein
MLTMFNWLINMFDTILHIFALKPLVKPLELQKADSVFFRVLKISYRNFKIDFYKSCWSFPGTQFS